MPQALSHDLQNAINLLKNKYENITLFLSEENPSRQLSLCQDDEDCYLGDYPTLALVRATYGTEAPAMWLVPQLYNLSEFTGSKTKLEGVPLEECASIIATNYHYLKTSELMLFFYKFKSGRYGRFYGAVDPITILTALQEFVGERATFYTRKTQEKSQEKLAEHQWYVIYAPEWAYIKTLSEDEKERLSKSRWTEYRNAKKVCGSEEEIEFALRKRGFTQAEIDKAKKCYEYVERKAKEYE